MDDKINDLLDRWEQEAVPLDAAWREALAQAEGASPGSIVHAYMDADELRTDRDDLFAQFAEEAIDLLQKIKEARNA